MIALLTFINPMQRPLCPQVPVQTPLGHQETVEDYNKDVFITPGEHNQQLRPGDEGGGSMGDSAGRKSPAPADPYPLALTVPINYMKLWTLTHTEFQVYWFCADSMYFSCITYDV